MNDMMFDNLLIKRIGYSCFEESVSCALDYQGELIRALNYNFHMFLYNKHTFTGYEFEQDPKSYLFENNMLLFKDTSMPFSAYKKDYRALINSLSQEYFDDNLNMINTNDFEMVKKNYSDENICVCLLVDPFYLKEDYVKYNSKFATNARHLTHYVNLFNIDLNAKTSRLIDVNFSIKGDVSIDRLFEAAVPLEDYGCFCMKPGGLASKDEIIDIVKSNLTCSVKGTYVLNGNTYHTNTKALMHFVNDFEEILETVHSFAGECAPQYISYPLIGFRHMAKGHSYLFKIINDTYAGLFDMENIANLFKEYSDKWYSFDILLDKIYLKKQNILQKSVPLKAILSDLIGISGQIDSEINNLLRNPVS